MGQYGRRYKRQHAAEKKVKLGASVHLPFDKFQAMNLSLDLAVAPRQNHCRSHCGCIAQQPVTKAFYSGQTGSFGCSEPVLQCLALFTADHVSEALR